MRRPQGYAVIVHKDTGEKRECDTITCVHCNRIVFVPVKVDPQHLGGWCGQCGSYICGPCADAGTCTPLMKRIEAMEARGRMFKSLGLNS